MNTSFDRNAHKEIIKGALGAINRLDNSPFVLKGGTALMECYSLDRFSEDIDLDAPGLDREVANKSLLACISEYCQSSGYELLSENKKDTPTTRRVYIHYAPSNSPQKPLKVEVSYRQKVLDPDAIVIVNGIQTYTIDRLAELKASAYQNRDKIRDLYDLTFIVDKYYDQLPSSTKRAIRTAFEYKSIEQFDYIIKTQPDPLIDPELLETRFLMAFEKTGLLEPTRQPTPFPAFANDDVTRPAT